MKLFPAGIRVVIAFACLCALSQQAHSATGKFDRPGPDIVLAPVDMRWGQAPQFLPQGAEMALLEGDPARPGPFTIRLRLPPDYYLPPHRHITAERITVVTGALRLGPGSVPDKQKARQLEAGSFAALSANNYHYAFTEGTTVLQLHGRGPWQIMYADPADDPRKKQKAD